MKDCVDLAKKVCDLMADEGAEGNEQCAALITALALVVTTYKNASVSTAQLEECCVGHIRKAIRALHTAREALRPHG
jgi:hypothetical protein